MSRITDAFSAARARGHLALIPYLTCGYPSADETVGLVTAAVEAGADVVEFGVPFSDPMGDGLVIQHSGEVALAGGMSLARTLEQVALVRAAGITTPIALMGYLNPFVRYGVKRLADDAAAAGVDGFIVPDLPPDAGPLSHQWRAAADAGLDLVYFAAPGSGPARLAAAGAATSGFLYCMATNGVTGARDSLDDRLPDYLRRVRAATDAPLAVGFGISRPAQVTALHGLADGVIVGSALLREVGDAETPAARRAAVRRVVGALRTAAGTEPA